MSGIEDPRPLLRRGTDGMSALVERVTPELLEAPTPCTEFDVRALLEHVLTMTLSYVHLGEGATDSDNAEPGPVRVDDRQWPTAYREAAERLDKAWADSATLDRSMSMPWGAVDGRGALLGCLLDTVTHSWDLARALDTTAGPDEELAATTLEVARRIMPAERRGGATPFAPVRPVAEDAPASTRLAAWLGRDPEWTPDRTG
ncbi:TIGR03086 family metal-binding protein [Actinopolyspora mortivallis]|uniref:TIGR03086 family metal-binding protein n=1 Tax=Actinopolyspora mortivallis TaxID=33906 RepID=UPI000371CB75|nr:TIGR03086 family metal-binding protein [Actinopolyspora mortivallis]